MYRLSGARRMCCFVVWLTVFVRVRLFVGSRRHGLKDTGVAFHGRPSSSTLAEKVLISFSTATRSLLWHRGVGYSRGGLSYL